MYFDFMYLLFMLPGMLFAMWASARVQWAFKKYQRVGSRYGMTGAEAAQHLLDRAGIHDVQVVPTQGFLSDHYDPMHKRLALSEAVYSSQSIAAIGVATHEAGHAIQHAEHYAPLHLRSALVPTAGIGSSIGYGMMFLGLVMASSKMVLLGVILFSAVVLFQVITLPVEFDASARAKRLVVEAGIITPEERKGVDAVLNAAALTYVAAVVSTLLTILYFLVRSGLLGGHSRDE